MKKKFNGYEVFHSDKFDDLKIDVDLPYPFNKEMLNLLKLEKLKGKIKEVPVIIKDFTEQEITLFVGGNVEFETTYSEGCDWISFSKENYEGTHFSVAENPSSEARQGEIIFANSEYGVSAKVIVKQEGRPERPASPPSNQIWYSTWGYGETPYIDDSSFDQKIVSNIYYWDEKLGIITFEGDVRLYSWKPLEDIDQSFRISWMKSDARLVKNI